MFSSRVALSNVACCNFQQIFNQFDLFGNVDNTSKIMYQMVYSYLFSFYHKFFLRMNTSHQYVFHVQMAFLTAQAKKRPKCSLHQQKKLTHV